MMEGACSFLRFPGGCYVEGTLLSNAYYWKPSVGPLEQRPGHWNGMWEYWSTDGAQLNSSFGNGVCIALAHGLLQACKGGVGDH